MHAYGQPAASFVHPVDDAVVVFVHGGPGGGTDAKDRSFFDPTKYKVRLIAHSSMYKL